MALASIANWLFNFAIGFFIPPAFQNISWKLFIIFGVLCVGASIQAFVSYPETAGKTIEEVELLFSKVSSSPREINHLLTQPRMHLDHGRPSLATACSTSAWLRLLLSTDASAALPVKVRRRRWMLRRSTPRMKRTRWCEQLMLVWFSEHCINLGKLYDVARGEAMRAKAVASHLKSVTRPKSYK
jgi:Sugar (and other) transporter